MVCEGPSFVHLVPLMGSELSKSRKPEKVDNILTFSNRDQVVPTYEERVTYLPYKK